MNKKFYSDEFFKPNINNLFDESWIMIKLTNDNK